MSTVLHLRLLVESEVPVTRDWPYDVIPPESYKVCLRCPVFIPITKPIPLCHGCAKEGAR